MGLQSHIAYLRNNLHSHKQATCPSYAARLGLELSKHGSRVGHVRSLCMYVRGNSASQSESINQAFKPFSQSINQCDR